MSLFFKYNFGIAPKQPNKEKITAPEFAFPDFRINLVRRREIIVMVKNTLMVLIFAVAAAASSADALKAAGLFQQENYPEVIAEFERFPAAPSGERNKAAHFAILAMSGLKDYSRALALAEKMTGECGGDKAWRYRFRFHRMKLLGSLGRAPEALKIIPDAGPVPPAFKGEYYCLYGELREQAGEWREALVAYDYGAQAGNDFAGRARLSTAKAYEKHGFPLPALEAYLRTLSMIHVTIVDRTAALNGAVRLLDKVDRGREEVQDVLSALPAELQLAEAGKLLVAGDMEPALNALDRVVRDTSLPLSMRDYSRKLRGMYERKIP